MIPHHSREGKRRSHRSHFQHKANVSNCTPESVLHLSFKEMLYQKLKNHIISATPFAMEWTCSLCDENHTGDLIKKAKDIKLEYNMGFCRPDIALLDAQGRVFAVIEVVVTHFPEERVLQYYKQNNIELILVELDNEESLELLDQSPFLITTSYCPIHAKCKVCKSYKIKKTLMIMSNKCWKCRAKMKVAAVDAKGRKYNEFDKKDIETARNNGIHIMKQYSHTVKKSYMGNTCPKCWKLSGDYYLEKDYERAKAGYIPYEKVDAGDYCPVCENEID